MMARDVAFLYHMLEILRLHSLRYSADCEPGSVSCRYIHRVIGPFGTCQDLRLGRMSGCEIDALTA